jgi:predicted dithiol-disulfide oxidoreductase (DUF899 family)
MERSPEYEKLRAELQEAEIALRDQRERVAELRRALPDDSIVEDHVFRECVDGALRDVRLSQLFEDPDKTLVLMHFMFGKAQTTPCPMCSLWADGYDGIVRHLLRRVNFAVVIAGDPRAFAEYAAERGWRNLRVVSSGDTSFKPDLGLETGDGSQLPGVSVHRLASDGSVRLTYSACAFLGEAGFRGMDLLSPFWNFLDLTPEGRGDFFPQVRYD